VECVDDLGAAVVAQQVSHHGADAFDEVVDRD
jgi:hypothetical protein